MFYEVKGVPANSQLLLPTREEAVAFPRGDVALEFCRTCGLIFNGVVDTKLIDHRAIAEESSPFLRAFQQRLAHQLIECYALHRKNILEIGCGRGEFLALLCELGPNRGIGLDPGYAPAPQTSLTGIDVSFRYELFTEGTEVGPTDLVCSRMLLEQIANPTHFLGLLRRLLVLRKGARLFLQVSNVVETLIHHAFWEIYYARCSYFSPGTLHRLLHAGGFAVSDIWTDLGGRYLMADSRAAADATNESSAGAIAETTADLAGLVARFADACGEKQAMWCEILRKLAGDGNRIAIWGADSKAASFLTTLAVGDEVSYVVDVNPCRQGKFTPGTGHRIAAPDVVVSLPPDVVIVLNSVLTSEITDHLVPAGCAPTLLIA